MRLTLTLTSSNNCMSPLSLSACFPTDVLRHFMYSLPNPSESERPFSPLEEPVLQALGRRGGGVRNGTDSYALRQGCHAIGRRGHRIQKAQYHWPWAVGAVVVGTVGGE
jgi:hypothetical protein